MFAIDKHVTLCYVKLRYCGGQTYIQKSKPKMGPIMHHQNIVHHISELIYVDHIYLDVIGK